MEPQTLTFTLETETNGKPPGGGDLVPSEMVAGEGTSENVECHHRGRQAVITSVPFGCI